MTPQTREEILAYARSGNLIAAIKVYRTATGVGLAEAKAAVEAMVAGGPDRLPSMPAQSPGSVPTERVRELLSKGNKIEAIKVFREATGAGLAEAKEQVEQIAQQAGAGIAGKSGVQKSGCFGLLLFCGAAGAVLLERIV